MTVAELKAKKKELKITTYELSRMADVPNGTLSKILTGETKNPSHATMEKLEQILMREEMERRLTAYRIAMGQYFENNPSGSQKEFEEIYRRENHLNDAPIYLSTRVSEEPFVYGATVRQDTRVTTEDPVMRLGGRDRELIDGTIITCDMPGVAHQDMVERIGEQIRSYIKANGGTCKVYVAGLNVYLDEDEYTLVIPDVVVVCNQEKLKDKGLYGAPDWVIEVVSPSTREVDYHKKLYKYMSAGVREYWIVDMDREMVSVCTNGEPMQVTIYHFGEEIPVELYERKLIIQF